jgi:sigma-E factor negative regulatory protein RseC
MSEVRLVEHTGYIEEINSSQVKVRITSESACASCHAKGACTAADMQEKIIEAFATNTSDLKAGQRVIIQGKQSLGLKASLLAYIYPFFLVLIVLFVSYSITENEGISGIVSLLILVPYYLFIKLITPKLQKTFTFTIKE